MPAVPKRRSHPASQVLADSIDEQGRYDAIKLAGLLDWTQQEMAAYLGKDPSAISRSSTSRSYQEPLAALAALVTRVLDQMDGNWSMTRAWLQTPSVALDRQSPKKKIMGGQLVMVDRLLTETESGFAL
jgi:hypothetical protein